jgi:hypothetical protein
LPQSYVYDNYSFSWHCKVVAPRLLGITFTVLCNAPSPISVEKENFASLQKAISALQQQYLIVIQE